MPLFFRGGSGNDGQQRDALVVGARGQPLLPRLLGRGLRVPGATRVELGGLALEGRERGVVGVGALAVVVVVVVAGGGGLFFFALAVVALVVVVAAALVVVVALEQLAALLHARLFVLLRFGFIRLHLVVGAAPKVVVEGA